MMLMKLVICSILIFLIQTTDVNGNPQTCQQCSCHQCTSDIQPHIIQPNTLIRGKAGPKGIKGEEGHHGKKGEPGQDFDSATIKELYMKIRQLESDSNQIKQLQNKINQLESELNETKEMENRINQLESELHETKQMEDRINELESELNQTKQMEERINQLEYNWKEVEQKKPGNCTQIKEYHPESTSGIYRIYENFFDQVGREVSCDMTSEGVEMLPHNCKEILDAIPSASDGVYKIQINPSTIIDVMCDMTGGGWTVFQKRFDGSENFRRSFNEYSVGFGHPSQEHWLGLNNIHELTSQPGRWTLRVELQRYDGETAYAQYEDFSVGAGTDYTLSVGTHSGTAGDSMEYSNGALFSAHDKDQDGISRICASDSDQNGAWWWKNCGFGNLNGHTYGNNNNWQGMVWYHWKNGDTSLASMEKTEMKIKRVI